MYYLTKNIAPAKKVSYNIGQLFGRAHRLLKKTDGMKIRRNSH
jgi:hypothetical protein